MTECSGYQTAIEVAAEAMRARLERHAPGLSHDRLSQMLAGPAVEAVWPVVARVVADQIADQIARIAPPNCELRSDGSEDPLAAAWVEGLRDAHTAALNFIVAADPAAVSSSLGEQK